MREPACAGQFYSEEKEELNSELNLLFNFEGKKVNDAKGIIVPHAGYIFSGRVAARAYSAISKINKKRFVVLGPDHYGVGSIATSNQNWKTPLGEVKIDKDFVKRITKEQAIVVHEKAMEKEHSIEVQLPFLQYVFGEFYFVPVQLPNISYEEIKHLARILKDRNTFYIASSDFIHYGNNFRFLPEESIEDPLNYVKTLDSEIVEMIQKFQPKEFLDYIIRKDLTVCGFVPITLLLELTKMLGAKKVEKIAYDTSFSIVKDIANIVGYCSLIIR